MSDELLEELEQLGGSVTTEVAQLEPDEEEVWTRLPDDRPGVELALPGQQVNPPKVCPHRAADVMVETLVAYLEEEQVGDTLYPSRWEIRLKAICQCGIDFAVAREGRAPRDGSPGTVLVLTPQPCDTRGNPD